MILRSISIAHFRGIEHLEINNIPSTGLVMISGPNEQGKSTIMEAIHHVLHTPFASSKKEIRATQPYGKDVGPEVTLTLEIGPYCLSIHKRWLKSKIHELAIEAPVSERGVLTGTNADQRLAEIIGTHMDSDLSEALFMRQGEAAPAIEAAGIPALTTVLSAEGEQGNSLETEALTELEKRVQKEYSNYFSATGKPSGDLLKARNAVADGEEAVNQARQYHEKVQQNVVQVEQAIADQELAQAKIPEIEQAQREIQQEIELAEKLHHSVSLAQSRWESATHQQERAARALEDRNAAQAQMEKALAKAQQMLAGIDGLAEKAQAEEQAVEAAREKQSSLLAREEHLQQKLDGLRIQQRKVLQREELARLLQEEEEIGALTASILELKAVPEIAGATLAEVEEAQSELKALEAVAKSTAASLQLELRDGSEALEINLDGAATQVDADGVKIPVLEDITVEHAGLRAIFKAGESTRDRAEAVTRARARLERLLEQSQVDTLEQLKEKHAAWVEASHQLNNTQSSLNQVLAGRSQEEVKFGIAALRDALEGEGLEKEDNQPDLGADRGMEELVAEISSVEAQLGETRVEYRGASAALELALKGGARLELLPAQALANDAEEQAQQLAKELAQKEVEQPSEKLQQELEAANSALNTATEELHEAKAKAQALDLAALRAEGDAIAQELENTKIREAEAGARLDQLQKDIHNNAGAAEALMLAEENLHALRRRAEAVERRAAAAHLLHSTLRNNRDEARRKYAAPYVQELKRLARAVYGHEVEFQVDDALTLQEREVGHIRLPIDSLSGGAKEQLAVLNRFAIAKLTAQSQVPVFIDDALGATDQRRIRKMAGLFEEIAQHTQVFVLTCVPERYDSIRRNLDLGIESLKQIGSNQE